jgi:hypothetical protein
MMYHVNIINLFQPFFGLHHLTNKTVSYLDRARAVTTTSLHALRRLLALQESRHGWASTITLVLHPLSVTSFGSLDEIAQSYSDPQDAQASEPYQGLLACFRALSMLCSYSFYAQPLFRLLMQKCQAMGLQLPVEVQSTLDYYTSEEWTRNAANLVSSQYIADTRKPATDVDSARMDAIISAWEGLRFEERGKGKGRMKPDGLSAGHAETYR